MLESESTRDRIYTLIKENPALTTSEIGSRLELSRNTAAKYLAIMESTGIVYNRTAGPSKIWFSREVRLKELVDKAYDALVSLESITVELSAKDEKFPISIDEIEKMKKKFEKYRLKY